MPFNRQYVDGNRVRLSLPKPEGADRIVIQHDPIARPLANMLTVALNTDIAKRESRTATTDLTDLVSSAFFGLHFAPRLVTQGDTTAEPADDPEGGMDDEGDEDGNAAEGDAQPGGWEPLFTTQMTANLPSAYGVVLNPELESGQSALMENALAVYKAIGMALGMTVRAATQIRRPYAIVANAFQCATILSGQRDEKGKPVRSSVLGGIKVASGPYIVRPVHAVAFNEAKLSLDPVTGLVPESSEAPIGQFLMAMDVAGWGRGILNVRSDDPRLEGLHPNNPAASLRKRMIIAERMNNVALAYKLQLVLFWLTVHMPFVEAAVASSYFDDEDKKELARLKVMKDSVPLHPILAALAKSALAATANVHEMEGPALILPWAVDGVPIVSYIPARNRSWSHLPWLVELAIIGGHSGWATMLEASDRVRRSQKEPGSPEPTAEERRRAALARLLAYSEQVGHHIAADPEGWRESLTFLHWQDRAVSLPPVQVSLAQTNTSFTDGLACSIDPAQLLHGTYSCVPARTRKLAIDRELVVRMPIQQYSVIAVPMVPGEPVRHQLGFDSRHCAKANYMGEPAEKVYLSSIASGWLDNGVPLSDVRDRVGLILGPQITHGFTVPRRETLEPDQYRPTHLWPSKPAEATIKYDPKADGAVWYVGNLLTGTQFQPMKDSSLAFTGNEDEPLGDLDDDYNKGGGLLVICEPGKKFAPADGLRALPTTKDDLLKAIESIEVRVIDDPNFSFAPRMPVLMQRTPDAPNYVLLRGEIIIDVFKSVRPLMRLSPSQPALTFSTAALSALGAAVVPAVTKT